ncbi:hypothetical protein ABK040_008137 [Willaertia magna]
MGTRDDSNQKKLFTSIDVAGPQAKSYLKMEELVTANAHHRYELYEYFSFEELSKHSFKTYIDLIHRFIIFLLLESKPLFTVKPSENDHLERILKDYSINKPLQYLKEENENIDYFFIDTNYSSLFDVYNNEITLQKEEKKRIIDYNNQMEEDSDDLEELDNEEEQEQELEEKENFKKKKKIIEYVPPFISNYFLNITRKYIPVSKLGKEIYNEIHFKSFEDMYYNINRLIFDDQLLSNFITTYFNFENQIIENTNLDKNYLLEIICRGFCVIGEIIVIEMLSKIQEASSFSELNNEFIFFKRIKESASLDMYCFSLLFTNDFTIIQSCKDLTTFIENDNIDNDIKQIEKNYLFKKLPIDIHSIILRFIDNYKDLLDLRIICKHWNNLIVNNNDIWKYQCYNTLIQNSLFTLCNTQSLPFKEFEKRFNVDQSFTLFFTKIKPLLNFERFKKDSDESNVGNFPETNYSTCIYINPNNFSVSKGSTKTVNNNNQFQPDLPPAMSMKEDERCLVQLNCKELSRFFSGSYLPKTGMIYIFQENWIENKIRVEYTEYEFDYDKSNTIEIVYALKENNLENPQIESGVAMLNNGGEDILSMKLIYETITISKQDSLQMNFNKAHITNILERTHKKKKKKPYRGKLIEIN